jgi:hypothetical protein
LLDVFELVINADLLEVYDSSWRLSLVEIAVTFVVLNHSVAKDEEPFLPEFEDVWALLFQILHMRVVLTQAY